MVFVVIVHTKIARSQHRGVLASGQHYYDVKNSEKLTYFHLKVLAKGHVSRDQYIVVISHYIM